VSRNPDDQPFSPTVREFVAFSPLHLGLPEAEIHERVAEALRRVGMGEHAGRAPYHLSAGEKKRVPLATVLAMRPEILVLYEPSAGLDPRARRELISLLQMLGFTMLVSTRDIPMACEVFTRGVVMDRRRIVADGRSEGLRGRARPPAEPRPRIPVGGSGAAVSGGLRQPWSRM
jgi:cobalt/nickel transport system ATP-binding protein